RPQGLEALKRIIDAEPLSGCAVAEEVLGSCAMHCTGRPLPAQLGMRPVGETRNHLRFSALFFVVALPAPSLPSPPPDTSLMVIAVHGPVETAALGPTLMHEHIFVRTLPPAPPRRPSDRELYLRPLSLDILSDVEMGAPNRDNLMLADETVAVHELANLKASG